MDFDKIIPFIFFIIYILSIVLKKRPQSKKSSSQTSKPSILKTLFSDIAKQLQEEGQTRSPQALSQPSDGKNIKQKSVSSELLLDKNSSLDVKKQKSQKTAKQVAVQKPIRKKNIQKNTERNPLKKSTHKNLSAHNLREAVVWSEILAPPVGLRD